MVAIVVVAALSGMTVVAVVKLKSSRLTEKVERSDVTKVLDVESPVLLRSLWRS